VPPSSAEPNSESGAPLNESNVTSTLDDYGFVFGAERWHATHLQDLQ
jgi:hypothetical protein